MNIYKYIYITYYKIAFLLLSKFTRDFPSKLNIDYNIDIDNNNLNLILFTLETFDYTDFKSLLLNFNHSNIISELHFLTNTSNSYIYLFNSEGKLFGYYGFLMHNPYDDITTKDYDNFVSTLSHDILKSCVYETMNNNVSTKNTIFYFYISNDNLLEK